VKRISRLPSRARAISRALALERLALLIQRRARSQEGGGQGWLGGQWLGGAGARCGAACGAGRGPQCEPDAGDAGCVGLGEEQALNTWRVWRGGSRDRGRLGEADMLYPGSGPLSLCALFFLELLSVILPHPPQAEPSFCSWSPTIPDLPFRRMAQPSTLLELRRAWPCLIVGGIGCTVAVPAPGSAKLSEFP
jgi:hypothetical protein